MSVEPGPKRRTYRWPKEARDLVREYINELEQTNGESPRLTTVRDLVTRLSALTGFPREACLRFARQLGATGKQSYRGWTRRERQRLLDLVSLYPPVEIAKIMGRTVGSIRGMLARLHASAQSGRDWFTVYTLADVLHLSVQEIQRWITRGWLKSRIVETGGLTKPIISSDDFAEFCQRYRKEVIGRRLSAARLDFIHTFVFPPSHVDLLPVRERGYKRRVIDHQDSPDQPPPNKTNLQQNDNSDEL